MSEGLKGFSGVATAVADDKNGDRHSKRLSVEQEAVLSDSVICKDLSIAEVEISPVFFPKSMSEIKN